MSLVTTVYVPEGIVLSADSRIIININSKVNEVVERNSYILSDDTKKVKLLDNRFAVSAYGQVSLKSMPVLEHFEAFEAEFIKPETNITQLPPMIIDYFTKKFGDINTVFYLAGYNLENNIPVPYIYLIDVRQKIMNRLNKSNADLTFNASWGGETEMLTRLFSQIQVKSRGEEWVLMDRGTIHYEFMSLDEAVVFSRYLIELSEKMFRYQIKQQSVGGNIVSLVIPRHDYPYFVEE